MFLSTVIIFFLQLMEAATGAADSILNGMNLRIIPLEVSI